MLKSRLRITSCFLWVALTLLGFYPSSPAHAESFRTEGASDFYFELEAGNTFTVRAHAQINGIDSQLWLYNSANVNVAVNDDYFGLDSYISYTVQESGTYRLRTGVCCWDPNRWYGQFYTIDTNSVPTITPSLAPTTTLEPSTTTTLPPTTTTVATTTTTSTTLPPTTTTSTTSTSLPVPVQESSTTVATTTSSSTSSTTTTTVARTTTTSMTPTTLVVVPSTTSSVPPTTLPESTTSSTSTTTIVPNEAIAQGVSPTEALAIATSAEVLKELTSDQADKVFDAVEVSELSETQAEELIAAVQDAPEEVRAAFEDKINVFSGKFDKYVPLGSKVTVAVRKVLVAASGVLFMSPTVSVSTSGSSATESNPRRKRK